LSRKHPRSELDGPQKKNNWETFGEKKKGLWHKHDLLWVGTQANEKGRNSRRDGKREL